MGELLIRFHKNTIEAKRQRSEGLARLREIEDDLIKRGLIRSKRTVGRKPLI